MLQTVHQHAHACCCFSVVGILLQALDSERQQLRAVATEVAEYRAQQQAAAAQQEQQRQALQLRVERLQQQLQEQEQQHTQRQADLQGEVQRWRQQCAELQEQSRQQQEQGLQQLGDRLKEAVDQKQELQTHLSARLAELQQQLQDSSAEALRAAAEKAALTAQLVAAEQAKCESCAVMSHGKLPNFSQGSVERVVGAHLQRWLTHLCQAQAQEVPSLCVWVPLQACGMGLC